jgi:hypothetical protein
MITELAPVSRTAARIEDVVDDMFLRQSPLESLSPSAVLFLAELSERLLASVESRRNPEFVALAYWLRRANLQRIVDAHEPADAQLIRVARGMAFHVVPANVDTIALYSFALSLLAGNLNVVRVSNRLGERLSFVLREMSELMQQPRWSEIGGRNRFITYPHDSEASRYLSQAADVRILWGGNATVSSLRAVPACPDTHDIVFPDRFSYCVVDAAAYLGMDASQQQRHADAFFNDAYWFDQKACSSPSIVYFVGDEDRCVQASRVFWGQLRETLTGKRWASPMAHAMNHLVFGYELLAEAQCASYTPLPADEPHFVHVSDTAHRPMMCGGGMFVESYLSALEDLSPLVQASDQTLTYVGFDRSDIQAFARQLRGKGLTRFVPVGQALAFSEYWEGYDLIEEMTRLVWVH